VNLTGDAEGAYTK